MVYYQRTYHDEAVIILDLLLTASARINMYPDKVLDSLVGMLPVKGASERLQKAFEEFIHASRVED